MRPLCALLPLLLLALPAWAQEAKVVSKISEPNLETGIDLVILSEGYGQDEYEGFLQDSQKLLDAVLKDHEVKALLEGPGFNFHRVFLPSAEPGAPWSLGQRARKTPFKAWVNEDGDLLVDDATADVQASTWAPDVDVVVILIRFLEKDDPAVEKSSVPGAEKVVSRPYDVRANADFPERGKRVRQPNNDPEAFVHELGHALYGLGDEYSELPKKIPAEQAWEIAECPNLTTDRQGRRWKKIVSTRPYEGGAYYNKGVFRPEERCRMRESRSESFCKVCSTVIQGAFNEAPPLPRLVTPLPGARLIHSRGEGSLKVRWSSSQHPLYWALEILQPAPAGSEYEQVVVWEDYLEGYRRSLTIPLESLRSGKLTVELRAVNTAGEKSEIVSRTIKVVRTYTRRAGVETVVKRRGPRSRRQREH